MSSQLCRFTQPEVYGNSPAFETSSTSRVVMGLMACRRGRPVGFPMRDRRVRNSTLMARKSWPVRSSAPASSSARAIRPISVTAAQLLPKDGRWGLAVLSRRPFGACADRLQLGAPPSYIDRNFQLEAASLRRLPGVRTTRVFFASAKALWL